VPAAQVLHRRARVGLLKHCQDLVFGEPGSLPGALLTGASCQNAPLAGAHLQGRLRRVAVKPGVFPCVGRSGLAPIPQTVCLRCLSCPRLLERGRADLPRRAAHGLQVLVDMAPASNPICSTSSTCSDAPPRCPHARNCRSAPRLMPSVARPSVLTRLGLHGGHDPLLLRVLPLCLAGTHFPRTGLR
jgi:hypothetical protein